ncbi:MAG TPA: M12 family metallo-peptidase [Dokdonella sp.]|uniref:M12 family metallo-peptidase n=1 Tax=Dokdonella sp. TaxID=2291710 RepID=UPI002BE7DAF9|nr:M12 family metallo-peptidase [Dokdonella sp.]HUD41431.1 M12 family metallo-peptidase [Dokdonella sp.]
MHPERENQSEQVTSPGDTPNGLTPSGGPTWNSSCPDPLPTAVSVIDVLVMYTPAVFGSYGSTLAGVEGAAISAIANANNSLKNSNITTVRFSLRGVEPVPNPESFDYDQPNIGNALFHLAGVTGETPGQYPGWTYASNAGVINRRNAIGADVVALARRNQASNTCGAAFVHRLYNLVGGWIEPGAEFERKSYLVFDPSCDVDRLNLAHELGHLLGMEHDPLNTQMPGFASPTCPWSYGHRNSHSNPNIGFRTVMSYPTGVGTGGPICTGKHACPLIDAYSNPDFAWNGAIVPNPTSGAIPIGVQNSGSAGPAARANDTLARLAPIVAEFRARPEVIFANGFQ